MTTHSISTNAWANIKLGSDATSSIDTINSSYGITGARWISSGTHGFSFENPLDFSGGGYCVMNTPEIYNYTSQLFRTNVQRNHASSLSGATLQGTSAGSRYQLNLSNSLTPIAWNDSANFNSSLDVCINLAAFAFKRNSDIYIPAVRNLIKSDVTGWTNGSLATITEDVDPIGNPAYKIAVSNYGCETHISIPTSASNKTYTASLYAKSGTTGSIRLILGNSSGIISRYDLKLDLTGATGTSIGTSISGSAITSVTTNSGTNNTASVYDYENGWRKIVVTHRPASGGNGTMMLYMSTGETVTTTHFFASSPQIEEGSVATPFIPTGLNAPVVGNQDYRRSFVPGASGFGLTGATYSSVSLNTPSRRSATAYGTIVIPPIGSTASPVVAYLENTMKVLGLSAGGSGNTAEYDIWFTKPMNDANYCVLLSPENQAAVVAPPDYASMEEFSMLVVNRNWKTPEGFRVASLKQKYVSASDNKFTPSRIQATRGLTERIHFMVFGGATYGQP